MKIIFFYTFFICSTLISFVGISQTITTFAGGGSSGDGGLATAAYVHGPDGGVFDRYGNYYFTESINNVVRKVNAVGIITTIAGGGSGGDGGPASAASLINPPSICVDTFCNVYISDGGDYKIRKIDNITGVISTFAGNGTAGYGGDGGPATADSVMFNGTNDIVIDKFGNFFIADIDNRRIRKISCSGIITTYVGNGTWGTIGDGGPATAAEISWPYGLAVDQLGNLYFADNVPNERIRKVDTNGIITCIAGVGGSYTFNGDGIPATSANIDPIKVGVDKFGIVYIGDGYNKRLRYIDRSGYIYTICGNGNTTPISGDGIPATSSTTNFPSGITFDTCNNIYFTEVNNGRIRKITFTYCNYLNVYSIENQQYEVSIYPNPATEEITISGVKTDVKWGLFNIKSIKEQQGILKAGSNTLSIEALSPGLYILELTMDDGTRIMKKIIKL